MTRIQIELTASTRTSYIPLAALGYALRRAGLLDPLRQVALPIKTLVHPPGDKLIEALVLILAGGRSTAQADLLLRPNRALAQAWGQSEFAQQSTLADTLDAFDEASLTSLRSAFESTLRQRSCTLAHDFRKGNLFLDADLTGLPASRRAEGSTKGYFSGEKTKSVGNSPGSVSAPIMNRLAHCSIRASAKACSRSNQPWNWRSGCSVPSRINARIWSGAWMEATAVTKRSIGSCRAITNSWSKATTVDAPAKS